MEAFKCCRNRDTSLGFTASLNWASLEYYLHIERYFDGNDNKVIVVMQWTIYAKLNLDDIWHRFCWWSFKANYGIIWEFPPNGGPTLPFENPLFNCLLLEIGGPTPQGKNSQKFPFFLIFSRSEWRRYQIKWTLGDPLCKTCFNTWEWL